jgi:hypothetical protein
MLTLLPNMPCLWWSTMTWIAPLVDSKHFQILKITTNFLFLSMEKPCLLETEEAREIVYYLPIFIFIQLKFEFSLKFSNFSFFFFSIVRSVPKCFGLPQSGASCVKFTISITHIFSTISVCTSVVQGRSP